MDILVLTRWGVAEALAIVVLVLIPVFLYRLAQAHTRAAMCLRQLHVEGLERRSAEREARDLETAARRENAEAKLRQLRARRQAEDAQEQAVAAEQEAKEELDRLREASGAPPGPWADRLNPLERLHGASTEEAQLHQYQLDEDIANS